MLTYNGNILLTPSGKRYTVDRRLPPFTIRLLYKDGVIPTFSKGTGVQVSQNPNIWDLTYNYTWWDYILYNHSDLLAIIDANTTGVNSLTSACRNCTSLTTVALFDTSSVTYMDFMFAYCPSLTNVPLFDTSKVITMESMFNRCTSITSVPLFNTSNVTRMQEMFWSCHILISVPLFNTSKVTNVNYMFSSCYNVESGALALYNQMSTQANPPSSHDDTFYWCGHDTVTGAAELAQIPSSWGGTGS